MSEAEDPTFAAAAAAVDAAVGAASAATIGEPIEKKSKPSKSSSRRQCRFPGCESVFRPMVVSIVPVYLDRRADHHYH